MQIAIRLDGEQASVLRVLLQHISEKFGTSRLVFTAHEGDSTQPKEQLRCAGDFVIQIIGDDLSACDKLIARLNHGIRPVIQ